MARQASIISFDDALKSRRGTTARESRRATTARESRRATATSESRHEAYALEERRATTAREERRRNRTKARADKMFSKQFSSDAASEASSEGTPRPALYEGKMGSSHRKSARMQRSTSAGSPSAKINPSGWLSAIPISARSLKVATAVLCLFLTCTFLYVPAQQYYQAQREHDRLVVEHDIIEQRNEALDVQNDILASDAGMEDAVRQKYGYVKAGEQVANVSGLSDAATDTSRDSDNIEASVLSSTVRAPEEWYTPFLDAFFGVD